MTYEKLPSRLKQGKNFCLYRNEPGTDGKKKKVPYQANGARAAPNNPAHFTDYTTVYEAFKQGGYDGIGLLVTENMEVVDQYDLAGLTPEEFYQYATTGIYPLESYFGVPASAMMTGGDLKKVRRIYADEEAAKRREASKKKREEKRLVDPLKIVQRDKKLIESVIATWNDKKDVASIQISKMEELLKLIDKDSSKPLNLSKKSP